MSDEVALEQVDGRRRVTQRTQPADSFRGAGAYLVLEVGGDKTSSTCSRAGVRSALRRCGT